MKMKKEKSEKSISKKWLAVVSVALTTAAIVFIMLLNVEKTMLEDYEKTTVVVAKTEIAKGVTLTEENIGQYVEEKEVPLDMVPTYAFTMDEVISCVASNTIYEGVIISDGIVEKKEEVIKELREPMIVGFGADDLYQVVGGVLRPGDRIDIYHIGKEENASVYVWENIYIEEVFDNSGASLSRSDTTTPAQRINVYMEETEVALFFEVLEKGTVRVAKIVD